VRSIDLALTVPLARGVLTPCANEWSLECVKGDFFDELREREGNMASGIATRVNGTSRTDSLDRPVSAASAAIRPPTSVAAPVTPVKLLRFPVVRERTGLSRSTIWRLERRGEFPNHRRIAPNIVAWSELEVSRWIEERLGDDESGDREPALAGAGRLSRNA
jgi:prophage regulatory protein